MFGEYFDNLIGKCISLDYLTKFKYELLEKNIPYYIKDKLEDNSTLNIEKDKYEITKIMVGKEDSVSDLDSMYFEFDSDKKQICIVASIVTNECVKNLPLYKLSNKKQLYFDIFSFSFNDKINNMLDFCFTVGLGRTKDSYMYILQYETHDANGDWSTILNYVPATNEEVENLIATSEDLENLTI